MKKILGLIVLVSSCLCGLVFAGQVEQDLRSKGLHVADLSDKDKITLQLNRLEQAIRLQWTQPICNILAFSYAESDPSIAAAAMREQLPSIFSNLSSARRFSTQVNKETGWAVTCSHDFYIRILDMRIEGHFAAAECQMGFSFADENFNRTTDTLFFVSDNERWLLDRSGRLFTFLRQASHPSIAQIGTLDVPVEVLSQTKDDFVSTSLLAPVTFYHYGKTPIPRFNKTESVNWFGVDCDGTHIN